MSQRPPRMDALLDRAESRALVAKYGRSSVKAALGGALAEARDVWRCGGPPPGPEALVAVAERHLRDAFAPILRRVINATGVVLHTNLGRAPFPKHALLDAAELLSGYVDLEADLDARSRGHRDARLEILLRETFQTDRAVIAVNNNAAAVLLMLNTLARGQEAVVSRGELVEIGGGFRVPEVMAASGALLREVGTTNKTRLEDYRRASGPATGLLLKVHPSNYRIVGFTQDVALADLVALGGELGIPVGYDWGTGLTAPGDDLSLRGEESLPQVLAAAPDALCFSADKLLGACQAGLLLVRPDLAPAFRSNPLLRAVRVDKFTYAMLGAALAAYKSGQWHTLPALAMLSAPEDKLSATARRMRRTLGRLAPGRFEVEVIAAQGRAGGGTAPLASLPSPALALRPTGASVKALEEFMRTGGDPPILGVLAEGRLLIHVRTLLPKDAADILHRLASFAAEPS